MNRKADDECSMIAAAGERSWQSRCSRVFVSGGRSKKKGGVGENTGSFFDLNKKSLRGTAFSNLLSEARER